MQRTAMVVLTTLLVVIFSVSAKKYSLSVQKGTVEIVRSETGEQVIVSDSDMINTHDMVSLSEGQQASVRIEKNGFILIKGPSTLTLNEKGSQLTIALEDGQVLLNRNTPYEFSSLQVTAKKYTFTPMGTCAAVKTSKDAHPTTAVIDGKVRMQSPAGEAVVVEKGQFGSVGSNGKLATGSLSPRAIESLNQWLASAPESLGKTTSQPAAAETQTTAPATQAGTASASEQSSPSGAPAPVQPQTQQPAASSTAVTAQTTPPASGAKESQKTEKPAGEGAAAAPEEKTPDTAEKEDSQKKPGAKKVDKTPAPPSSPKWEISAGTATVDDKQWTRLALGVDVPIWKFGIFFDVELFIDNDGNFSDKGWNFGDDWVDALSRKIRYIRFGQEGDPLFIKFGGLSSVTMGYGFLVDRFTNMLHYPDQKLLGLQFDLNDISPVGITMQTLIADFKDFDIDGGICAARLAFRPLKMTEIPIVKGIAFGGSYATDLNQYAPARKWDFTLEGERWDRDMDGITDTSFYYDDFGDDPIYNRIKEIKRENDDFDTVIEHRDQWASIEEDPFGLIGFDIGIPIISTKLVGLDLYGQAGMRDDGKHGWGIGAPGVALKVWRFWANIEYRRVQGLFLPGYFGTYYLDERLIRDPEITTKEQRLISDTLNGVFGRLGFNIADVLLIDGSYQYMVGKLESSKDQRFEAIGSLGELVLSKIPKLNRAEIYYYKSRIGNEDDKFFEKTPFMYFGYRAGFEIAAGASLIWDARYGYKHDENGKLVSNNNISVQTAITF
jgi:hypothetical protein